MSGAGELEAVSLLLLVSDCHHGLAVEVPQLLRPASRRRALACPTGCIWQNVDAAGFCAGRALASNNTLRHAARPVSQTWVKPEAKLNLHIMGAGTWRPTTFPACCRTPGQSAGAAAAELAVAGGQQPGGGAAAAVGGGRRVRHAHGAGPQLQQVQQLAAGRLGPAAFPNLTAL